MLYYLNKLDFTDKVNDNDHKKLRCVKRLLVSQFEDYNVEKLVTVLSIIDNLVVTLMTGNLQGILFKTDTLREKIIYLISFKHFVESNTE